MTRDYSWELTSQQLRIAPPDAEMRDHHRGSMQSFWYELSQAIDGGFSFMRWAGQYTLDDFLCDASGKWSVQANFGSGPPDSRFGSAISGSWNDAVARPFIERIEITQSPTRRNAEGSHRVFLEYEFNELLGRWIAKRIEWRAPNGQLDRVLRVVRIESLSTPDYRALFRVPDPAGSDPIRGVNTFTSIIDQRTNEFRTSNDDGTWTREPIPGRRTGQSSWSTYAAWILASCLAIVLGVTVYRRRFHTP